jgi:hypothetical protein
MNKNLADARHLGIHLASMREKELFKWFLASLLFGKPIQTEIAVRAYQELVKAHLTGPGEICRAGWDRLVALLDQAHYVRYDFSTATKLLEVCEELQQKHGSLKKLLAQSKSASGLSRNLQEMKHIGPVTARIFLREVRPIWYQKAA